MSMHRYRNDKRKIAGNAGAFSLVILVFLSGAFPTPTAASESTKRHYTIGVLAHRGGDVAVSMWTPTAAYLSENIPNAMFQIEPLELFETRHVAQEKSIDLLLTNPGNFVEIAELYGLKPLASLVNLREGELYTTFGAVIFTRADRTDIVELKDLKGKSFMGVKQSGFGGFQMAWRELVRAGVQPFNDFATLQFSGFPQDGVAFAVRDKLVDAGTFRTDTLERMAKNGKIDLSDFKILNRRTVENFPFALSTALYPEWSIAALTHLDATIGDAVAKALKSMPPKSEEALAAKSAGWVEPLSYSEVRDLLRELNVAPFEKRADITLQTFFAKYWAVALFTFAILLALVGFTAYVVRTNRKLDSARNELRLHRDKLEEIVRVKTQDLQRAHNAALEASGAKSQFLANTSHELRTPLNAIIGYSEMIIEGEEMRPSDALNDIRKIRDAGRHLLELINGILDLSKIEAGKMELYVENAHINELVGSVIETLQHLAKKNGNTIEFRPLQRDATILTDAIKLRQVITNLLSNACKFTSDGFILVEIREHTEAQKTWFIFSVTDSGIGMTTDQCGKLFDPFTQANHAIQHRFGGTGLGLTISRGFCDLMGGMIGVSSKEGEGTRFEVRLPKSPVLAVLPQSLYARVSP